MFSTVNTLPHQVLAQLSQLISTSSVITSTTAKANPGVGVRSKSAQKLRGTATAANVTVTRNHHQTVAPVSSVAASNSTSTCTTANENLSKSTSLSQSPAAAIPVNVAVPNSNILEILSTSNGLSLEELSTSTQDLNNLLLQSGFLNLNTVSRFWETITRVTTSSSSNLESSWNLALLYKNPKLVNAVRTLESSASSYRYHNQSSLSFKTLGSFELDKRFSPPEPFDNSVFNQVPNRTFKTSRDKEAEAVRNPSLFSRIKNKLFPPYNPSLPLKSAETGTSTTTPPPVVQFGVNSKQQERLKALMAELPADEASKLKIAFAEGYIAATPSKNAGTGTSRTERWLRTLQQLLGIAVFTAILAYLMGSIGGGVFRVNVGNGNEVQPEDINVTFSDVKGVDEAKAELQEIVEFLKTPEKFVQLGGKLPKGVLLVGPPGTGKTLLARAVAGEAGVPFFQAAGPEFDEILVGQGARRVRDLFKAAKAKAPCVIFIDEIDSVGAKRTNSVLHPYANQTINQLLTEMDGFRQNEGVIVLGATNRREDLDRALLRPGRFDVEVNVPAPELKGRKDILEYYLGRIKKGDDVDVDNLARGTTGFTGADLENMVNQAALRAAIEGADRVFKKHLDFARDKVLMGPERKTRIPDEETNRITAYHEAGHAIVAHYTKDSHPLHKVTIIPRGQSLGHTAYIPDKERYHVTRSQLMAMMDTMMGGRAAEELIFGVEKITSGASSDLKQATSIASQMVKEWGMSEKVGLRTVEDNSRSLVNVNELGNGTNELIDKEINRLLNESYDRAKCIIIKHAKEHESLADALMKYETLDADDVKGIFSGQGNNIGAKKEMEIKSNPTKPKTPPSTGPAQGQPGIGPFGLGKRNQCP